MKPALIHRLVGFCVFSTVMIAAFNLKIVWWQLGLATVQRSAGIPANAILAIAAAAASIGSWREKSWGYILAILLCARENISAFQAFSTQPAHFRVGDFFGLALSGVPVALGMIAAIVLLLTRRSGQGHPAGEDRSK